MFMNGIIHIIIHAFRSICTKIMSTSITEGAIMHLEVRFMYHCENGIYSVHEATTKMSKLMTELINNQTESMADTRFLEGRF